MSDKQQTEEALEVVGAVEEGSIGLFERLATDPNVDVDKLERLIAMRERELEKQAESAFNAAMVPMQLELPEVLKKGNVDFTSTKGRTNYSHARMEDIQRALRPVLGKYGFALTFSTDQPEGGGLKVTAHLRHVDGHSCNTSLVAPPDTSGNKNAIQAMASTESYLMRYTTVALLNLTTTDMDNDGAGSEAPKSPEGFEDWLLGLEVTAMEEGTVALQKLWEKSDNKMRTHLTKYQPATWSTIKDSARKAKS